MDHDLRRGRKLERSDHTKAVDHDLTVVDNLRHNFQALSDFHSILAILPLPTLSHHQTNHNIGSSVTAFRMSTTEIGMLEHSYFQAYPVLTMSRFCLQLGRQRR
jgi:hypothetical protein